MGRIDEETAKKILVERDSHNLNEDVPVTLQTEEVPVKNDESAPKSLGKAKMMEERATRREEALHMASEIGWKNVPVDYLPSKGIFYEQGTQITIRAASVQEIRHFSSIEEDDYLDIDEKLNFILDKCVRVKIPRGITSYKDILEVDRFSLIFAVRDLTFKDGENKIQMTINCPSCGNSDSIILGKDNIGMFTLDDKLLKYYSQEDRAIVLNFKNGDTIKLYIPTLGTSQWIKNMVKSKRGKNEYIDRAFLKLSGFLFQDWRQLNDRTYSATNDLTFKWDVKKMSVVVGILSLIENSIDPNIKHNCTACHTEVQAPISFQGGIKSLFLYNDIFAELI